METLGLFYNLQGWEILLIFFVILLLFGAKRLPELAKSMGKSVKEFRKATSKVEEDFRSAMDAEPEKVAQTPAPAKTTEEPSEKPEQA